LGQT